MMYVIPPNLHNCTTSAWVLLPGSLDCCKLIVVTSPGSVEHVTLCHIM
jgi:hypothetical protein